MWPRACMLVWLALAAAAAAPQYTSHGLLQPAQHIEYSTLKSPTPRPKLPPGGFAPPDALEVATRRFIQQYQEAAARSAAAPDIDIHTTTDGLPAHQGAFPPSSSVSYARVPVYQRQAHSPPQPVQYTPEVAAARADFQRRFQAELARAPVLRPAETYQTQHQPQPVYHHQPAEPPQHWQQQQQQRRPQPPARLLLDQRGNVIGVVDSDEVAAARDAFRSQYDTIASLLASQTTT